MGKLTDLGKKAVGTAKNASKAAMMSLIGEVVKELMKEGYKQTQNKSQEELMEIGKKAILEGDIPAKNKMSKDFIKNRIKKELDIK